jgi:hypothetical protein
MENLKVFFLKKSKTKEHKTGYNRDTCTLMFVAALFTIPKLWEQPSALKLMNGSRKCDLYTQWSIIQL